MKLVCAVAILACACGDDLASQLVRVSAEPPGAHCATGGTAVEVGLDRNGDGVLEDAEVESVQYVCDGSGGSNGAQILVDTQPEPPGAHCATGGVAVRSGLDADGDHVLDESEVQQTSYVCNASNASTLVETRPEPPGANCTLGGTAIVVGIDADGDGVLAPAEVTGTSFACNPSAPGKIDGNYFVNNTLDLALLAGITAITGTLSMGARLDSVDLPDLELLGAFALRARVANLPALRIVGGTAMCECNELHVPALQSVGGTLFASEPFGDPVAMSSLDLPELQTVSEDFVTSPRLFHLSAPKLEAVFNGQMFLQDVTELALPVLTRVERLVLKSPNLATLSLPALDSVFEIELDLPGVTTVSLPALQHASTHMFVNAHTATTASFPALINVGEVRLDDVPQLAQLLMPAVTSIGGPVTVIAPKLRVCDVEAILAQANYTGGSDIEGAPCP